MEEKKINQRLFIMFGPVLILSIIAAGVFGYYLGIKNYFLKNIPEITPSPPESGVICTMDVKLCPDGSGVGRIPPNCEFAPCPTASPTSAIAEALINPDTSCTKDEDCLLINKEIGYDCCHTNGCQPINYSLDSWIAVNKKWYDERQKNKCITNKTCPNCNPKPINVNYRSACEEKTCVKIPL